LESAPKLAGQRKKVRVFRLIRPVFAVDATTIHKEFYKSFNKISDSPLKFHK